MLCAPRQFFSIQEIIYRIAKLLCKTLIFKGFIFVLYKTQDAHKVL